MIKRKVKIKEINDEKKGAMVNDGGGTWYLKTKVTCAPPISLQL
jgi:hypothetical protein